MLQFRADAVACARVPGATAIDVIEDPTTTPVDTANVLTEQLELVLQAVADAITVQDRSGRVVYANAAAAAMLGYPDPASLIAAPPGEVIGGFEVLRADGSPLPRTELPGSRALEGRVAGPRTVHFRVRATGEERWAVVRASPLVDPDGVVTHAVSAFQDVTPRVLAERDAQAALQRYRSVVESVPVIAWTTDATGRLETANARWFEYTGRVPIGLRPLELGDAVHAEDQAALDRCWAEAVRTGAPLDETVRLRQADGVFRWHIVRAVPVRDESGAIASWIGTATDIDDAKRAEERSRLVAAASERLDESLDLDETVRAAASIAVPALADVCVIDLLEADGSSIRASVFCADPDRASLADELMAYPSVPGSGGLMGDVTSSGHMLLIERIDEAELKARIEDDAHAEILRKLGARSAIAMPLMGRGVTLGSIALIQAWSERTFQADDAPLVEELARRAGLALANARLYSGEQEARKAAERERDRTQRLQTVTGRLAEASADVDVAALVLAEARAGLGATAGTIYLLDSAAGMLHTLATEGYAETALEGFRDIPIGSPTPLASAVRSGEPHWISDLLTMRGITPEIDQALEASGHRAAVAIPLRTEGRVIGGLGLSFPEPRNFTPDERGFALALTELAAQNIVRTQLAAAQSELLVALDTQRARLQAVLEQAPVGLMLAEAPSGRLLIGNAELERMWGMPFVAGTELRRYRAPGAFHVEDGRPIGRDEWPVARALTGEIVEAEEIGFQRPDGVRATLLASAAPVRDRGGRITAAVGAFTDITERRIEQEQQRYLAEASQVLGSSLDHAETLRRIAELAVPRLADWISIELVNEGGALEQIVLHHVDPAKVQLAREWRERFPPDRDSPLGPYAVIRTGRSQLMTEVPPELVEHLRQRDPERAAIVEELQVRSYMAVPLKAALQTIGVISFLSAESGRRYGPDDLVFAENLAARAAGAIENARLFRDSDRFRRLLDASLDVVLVIEPETLHITYANRGAAIATGIPVKDLVGSTLERVLPDLDAARLRYLVESLTSGESDARTVTLGLQGADGVTPVEVLFQRIGIPDEPARTIAIARDITERIEAQARLQRLAEAEHARAAELDAVIHAMGEGVFVCAADGSIVLSNPAAENLFPSDERTYDGLLAHLEDPTQIAPRLGTRGGPVELRAEGADDRWVEIATYPVAGRQPASQRGLETIVMLRDVTEARQQQLVRDTFVGVLSHELRTPVTTIYGGAKILARESTLSEEQRREVFEDIHTEAERLHRLVEDVIALNRFGEDEGEVGHEPVLLQRILPPVVRGEEVRWPGVTFDLSIHAGMPTVIADPTYVEQAVRNLLSNAAKYGGAGTTVRVILEPGADEGLVRIIDDGPGFPEQEGDRLFDLFFRSASTAARAPGAGIGLFVTSRLISAMGGRVWARSAGERGAEFGFALRVMEDQ